LLFPQPRKRAVPKPPDLAPDLSTPEKIQLSIDQNLALFFEAKRRQEQNTAEAGRIENDSAQFTLFQRRVMFAFEIAITTICLIALVYFGATDPESAFALVSGGSLAGVASLLIRKRRKASPE
jgi:hypothetical protein